MELTSRRSQCLIKYSSSSLLHDHVPLKPKSGPCSELYSNAQIIANKSNDINNTSFLYNTFVSL